MRKDEKYIKALLEKHLGNEGVFRQFEFSSWGMETRPDYVILYPDKFVYYEIKSEFDSFARLENQIRAARAIFTETYLVAPESMLKKAVEKVEKLTWYCGQIALEDLENGILKPREKQIYEGTTSLEAVSNILWSEEHKELLNDVVIYVNGEKLSKADMRAKSRKVVELAYCNSNGLHLLNRFLPKRTYRNRQLREYKKEIEHYNNNLNL